MEMSTRAQAFKKRLKGGPLKLHLEPLLENPVIEYHYDGTEKHAPPYDIDDVAAEFACKVDWRAILGPDDTLEPLYALKKREFDEEEAEYDNNKTEHEKEQEHMNLMADLVIPEAGPWATVAKALNESLAEVDNLLDIVRIIKDGNGLVVATVAGEPPEKQADLASAIAANKAFLWQAHRKILSEAGSLFHAFENRNHIKDGDVFFKELREIRKLVAVKKVGDCLIGDLGFKPYGNKWNPSETFDIYRIEETKRCRGIKREMMPTMMELDVPRHLAVRTCVFVSLAFDGENENMFKKKVLTVVRQTDDGKLNVVENKAPDEDDLERMEALGQKPNLSRMAFWPNALQWAQDTLFYRDMFTLMTRECAGLVGRSCSIRDDIIVVSLFENVMLKIEKCESTFVDGDLTDLGDLYLKGILKSYYYKEICSPAYRPAQIVSLPNMPGSLPLLSELDGAFCATEEELQAKNPVQLSLVQMLMAATSHYFLVKTAIEILTEFQAKNPDPVLTWKWLRMSPTTSIMFVTPSSPGNESVSKNPFHMRITEEKIEVIGKDGNVSNCRRDRALLIESLHYQAALFWFTATSFIAMKANYSCLQSHTNQFDEQFKISPTLLVLNPNSTRQIFIQFFCTGKRPLIMTRTILDAHPDDITPGSIDQREFTVFRNSRIPGSSFLKQIDTLFSIMRS